MQSAAKKKAVVNPYGAAVIAGGKGKAPAGKSPVSYIAASTCGLQAGGERGRGDFDWAWLVVFYSLLRRVLVSMTLNCRCAHWLVAFHIVYVVFMSRPLCCAQWLRRLHVRVNFSVGENLHKQPSSLATRLPQKMSPKTRCLNFQPPPTTGRLPPRRRRRLPAGRRRRLSARSPARCGSTSTSRRARRGSSGTRDR